MAVKSEKVEKFCYEVGYLNIQHTRAYIHAYPNNHYPAQSSQTLLQQIYVQDRVRYWQGVKAKDIAEKQAKDAARLIISRERQTGELEKLRKKCMHKAVKDYATALGCIREEDKVHGLVIDVAASGDSAMAEIDDARRAAAAAIPDEYFLNTPKLPELAAAPANSPSRDAAGLTNNKQSDVKDGENGLQKRV